MKSIIVLLFAFVGIGIFARKFDKRIHLLLILAVVCLVVYATIK